VSPSTTFMFMCEGRGWRVALPVQTQPSGDQLRPSWRASLACAFTHHWPVDRGAAPLCSVKGAGFGDATSIVCQARVAANMTAHANVSEEVEEEGGVVNWVW